jgi:hypothetical protein
MDANDRRDDAADFGGSVELALALPLSVAKCRIRSFVGVTKNVVAIGPVLTEVEFQENSVGYLEVVLSMP